MNGANVATDTTVAMSETNSTSVADYNSISLRLSHPNLYRSIMTFAVLFVFLGLNFMFTKPTFNPYSIPKEITGSIFLTLGLVKIVFLNLHRSLRLVRLSMGAEVAFMLFWGVGTSITYFQGRTSLQLACLYASLALFEVWLLLEPFANPMTGRKGA